jgi:broad specificity phosphatase PhoE
MSHITLIRHGQANSEARDEASYDRLSPLGHQQAQWLGDHLDASGDFHPRVYSGTLTRQVETVSSMGVAGQAIRDPRLNEMSYFALAEKLEQQKGLPIPTEREGFMEHLPRVFSAWQADEIDNPPERFSEFESRVSTALAEIAQGAGPALVVTSGGVIAMAMRQSMGLDSLAMARITLAIMNTSMHRLFPMNGHLSPVLFNAVPHLDDPARHTAQTHI